ncbi:MAG: 3-oxoacyl-ACP synthase [Spirochaetaceae bacterium]|jgi:3-oxoacyl-[acyl-carrier-protein] synthase-1|nr:3-oxoacyl-ACP synthase [Spirochaetaceae bacterium]
MKVYLSRPGALSAAGTNIEDIYRAVCNGDQSGIKRVNTRGAKTFLAGHITENIHVHKNFCKDYALPEYAQETLYFKIAFAALEQIKTSIEKAIAYFGANRIALCLGSCDNGSEASIAAHHFYFNAQEPNVFPVDYALKFQSASFLAECIAHFYGIKGPVITVETACASGAGAIIKGAEFINAGFCDAVIAGGVDIASDIALLGFASLGAISDTISNPFSKNRNGITLGDGACFFIMSKAPLSSEDKNKKIALIGCGESADAHHITGPKEDGSGAASAMRVALANAKIKSAEIEYINLHGTGTPLNDAMEARAIETVFGKDPPPASSTKPMIGHTLGAAGALEAAICYQALNAKNALPVHCFDGVYDEKIPRLHFVEHGEKAEHICMSNSYAFGGCNTSLILADCG